MPNVFKLNESTMSTVTLAVQTALAAIHDADLPHPNGELLDCFISEAADKNQAAAYLLRKISEEDGDAGLAGFLSEWTALIASCESVFDICLFWSAF
jgi:hypothetical protein